METFNIDLVQKRIQDILKLEASSYNIQALKTIFSCIDLTSLKTTDHSKSIAALCAKVNDFNTIYPNMPQVAALCVYPSMVESVKENLKLENIGIASVAAGFPASQTFLSIKIAESELAVNKGATEIDIVISLGLFLNQEFESVSSEIRLVKEAIGERHLKVILETALMPDLDSIYNASVLAIKSGADFIKTSTGKEGSVASLEAVYMMCKAIKEHYAETGQRIGLKPAGGISNAEDAFKYYALVKNILGEAWLNSTLFRFGASSLANNIINEIDKLENNEIKGTYF